MARIAHSVKDHTFPSAVRRQLRGGVKVGDSEDFYSCRFFVMLLASALIQESTVTMSVIRSAALLILSGLSALAQTTLGTITGRVLDSSGSAVSGAEVAATNTGTGFVYRTNANEAGNYVLPQLAIGNYRSLPSVITRLQSRRRASGNLYARA
jgi:hypothetical protein